MILDSREILIPKGNIQRKYFGKHYTLLKTEIFGTAQTSQVTTRNVQTNRAINRLTYGWKTKLNKIIKKELLEK